MTLFPGYFLQFSFYQFSFCDIFFDSQKIRCNTLVIFYRRNYGRLPIQRSIFFGILKFLYPNFSRKLPIKYTKGMLLSGIFAPEKTGGLSAYHLIADQEKKERMHFDIVSLYVSWGDQQQCFCLSSY